jgi:uncharacterized protein YoxC
MIDKIVKYVQEKLPVVVTESVSTNSKYIRYTDGGKQVRVSDHFGNLKDNVDVTIIVPENPGSFIVVMGFKTFIYSSFQKVAEFIVTYLILEDNVLSKETTKIKNQSQVIYDMQCKIDSLNSELDKIKKLNNQLQALNKNLASNGKEIELRKKVERQAAEIQILNEKQAESKKIIKQQESDIKEAAELLETLSTNPDLREMMYDRNTGKKYYLDNFSEEMQDVIKDLITNYYSK